MKKEKTKDTKKAFTLIELLVVVLIIGILSAVALPQYQKAAMKTRFTTMKILAHSLVNAEEIFHMANGQYTNEMDALDITSPEDSNISCVLVPYNEHQCVYVRCSHSLIQMGYQVYPPKCDSGRRICLAYNTDLSSLQNKVCQQESQRRSPDVFQTDSNAWYYTD